MEVEIHWRTEGNTIKNWMENYLKRKEMRTVAKEEKSE